MQDINTQNNYSKSKRTRCSCGEQYHEDGLREKVRLHTTHFSSGQSR